MIWLALLQTNMVMGVQELTTFKTGDGDGVLTGGTLCT